MERWNKKTEWEGKRLGDNSSAARRQSIMGLYRELKEENRKFDALAAEFDGRAPDSYRRTEDLNVHVRRITALASQIKRENDALPEHRRVSFAPYGEDICKKWLPAGMGRGYNVNKSTANIGKTDGHIQTAPQTGFSASDSIINSQLGDKLPGAGSRHGFLPVHTNSPSDTMINAHLEDKRRGKGSSSGAPPMTGQSPADSIINAQINSRLQKQLLSVSKKSGCQEMPRFGFCSKPDAQAYTDIRRAIG